MEKIRLNQQKRQLLKKEWQHTVYNNMPMQVEEDLRLAQENYRSVREDVWELRLACCLWSLSRPKTR